MPERKVAFVPNEFYHLYNRGNSKQVIFHDQYDYERFLKLLYLSNTKENFKIQFIGEKDAYNVPKSAPLVAIGAYCLMPNHFHLLVTQTDNGSISKYMQKVATGYSMYYNQKYQRTGSLFEGKFKAEHANSDRYLKYLFSYIHLNPIKLINKDWKETGIQDKKSAFEHLDRYSYSSYADYLDTQRQESVILDRKPFPLYFPTKESFKEEILDWLDYRKDL